MVFSGQEDGGVSSTTVPLKVRTKGGLLVGLGAGDVGGIGCRGCLSPPVPIPPVSSWFIDWVEVEWGSVDVDVGVWERDTLLRGGARDKDIAALMRQGEDTEGSVDCDCTGVVERDSSRNTPSSCPVALTSSSLPSSSLSDTKPRPLLVLSPLCKKKRRDLALSLPLLVLPLTDFISTLESFFNLSFFFNFFTCFE